MKLLLISLLAFGCLTLSSCAGPGLKGIADKSQVSRAPSASDVQDTVVPDKRVIRSRKQLGYDAVVACIEPNPKLVTGGCNIEVEGSGGAKKSLAYWLNKSHPEFSEGFLNWVCQAHTRGLKETYSEEERAKTKVWTTAFVICE